MFLEMIAQCLIINAFDGGFICKIRIETNILRFGYEMPKTCKTASEIKHPVSGMYSCGGEFKFLPNGLPRPNSASGAARIQLIIKCIITFSRRIKEIEARRRFPKAETLYRSKARACVDPKCRLPRINEETSCHP